jgi:hypothetical protein
MLARQGVVAPAVGAAALEAILHSNAGAQRAAIAGFGMRRGAGAVGTRRG